MASFCLYHTHCSVVRVVSRILRRRYNMDRLVARQVLLYLLSMATCLGNDTKLGDAWKKQDQQNRFDNSCGSSRGFSSANDLRSCCQLSGGECGNRKSSRTTRDSWG